MTLIELIVSFLVLGLSFAIYVSTAVAVRRQSVSVQDLSIASDACQRVVETLRSEPFDELVRRYGVDPDDDPNGAGTAPGAKFTVAGLHPALDDPDGIVGEVVLPELEVQSGVFALREDLQRPELGLPRDLNGDSIIDGLDHGGDYLQLPVCVRVRWQGQSGPCSYQLDALLVPFRR